MKIKSKVDAIFALDKLKETTHATDCKNVNEDLQYCPCGMLVRNSIIEDIKKFITSKKL